VGIEGCSPTWNGEDGVYRGGRRVVSAQSRVTAALRLTRFVNILAGCLDLEEFEKDELPSQAGKLH
jgi:hypothetical protein